MTLLNSQPLVLDKALAMILGLNEALILQQVHYWIEINKKKGRNYHEGRYWTYNTIKEWQEEFPFWSNSTIKRVFKRLRDMELIEVDNFNVYQMDRTLWYTINYAELERLAGKLEENSTTSSQVDQNCPGIGSELKGHKRQNEPMERPKISPALPENSPKTTTNIYSQSINPVNKLEDKESKKADGQTDQPYKSLKDRHEKILKDCEIQAIDGDYREAVIHAIKLLLLDIRENSQVKIGQNYIPVQVVERDMEKLNFFTIEYAVNKFKEASSIREIKNPLAYLKVLIYNSINEIQLDRDCKLRYEGLVD